MSLRFGDPNEIEALEACIIPIPVALLQPDWRSGPRPSAAVNLGCGELVFAASVGV